MFITKIIILLSSLMTVPDADGWVKIERPKKEAPPADIDPSIWVVFAKTLGSEKLLVRFPGDPTYRYLDEAGKELEVVAGMHKLVVREANGAPTVTDKTYWQDGFWHMERVITTKNHTYFFETKSESLDLISHGKFVSSFDIERAR